MVFAVENHDKAKSVSLRRKFRLQKKENLGKTADVHGGFSFKMSWENKKEKRQFYSGNTEFIAEKLNTEESKLREVI